jgi:hypothetical protein
MIIDNSLVTDISTSYKKLMAVCEEAEHAGIVMQAIDELRDHLNTFAMETDLDPRAQIRRAGGWEAWDKQGITKPKFKHWEAWVKQGITKPKFKHP